MLRSIERVKEKRLLEIDNITARIRYLKKYSYYILMVNVSYLIQVNMISIYSSPNN